MKTYLALPALVLAAGTMAVAQPLSTNVSDNGAYNLRMTVTVTATPQDQQPAYQPPAASNGVYLTADDFVNGQLTDAFADNTPDEQIWASTTGGNIRVKTPRVTESFPEARTWGYRKDGTDYRIVDRVVYEVVNHDDILMYRLVNVDLNQFPTPAIYYFSRFPDADLFPIRKSTLEMVYSDHAPFVSALKQTTSTANPNDTDSIWGGTALFLFRQADQGFPVNAGKAE